MIWMRRVPDSLSAVESANIIEPQRCYSSGKTDNIEPSKPAFWDRRHWWWGQCVVATCAIRSQACFAIRERNRPPAVWDYKSAQRARQTSNPRDSSSYLQRSQKVASCRRHVVSPVEVGCASEYPLPVWHPHRHRGRSKGM